MVHNAFDPAQILRDCPVKIESVGLWGARLLLGCIDGSLRIYAPEDAPSDGQMSDPDLSESSSTYILRNTRVGFAKKAITGMNVLQSRGLLITLSDAVAIHTLPDFDVVSYLDKTKGAASFAWNEDRNLLAVSKQKRVIIYKYDGNRDFIETKDVGVSDAVRSMAWCSEALFLGVKREYIIMNISTGSTVDVFQCGRIAGPLIVPLPNMDLLLGKDNIGVIVDCNGKLTQDRGLTWSEAPAAVVTQAPYALAQLSRFIEVRSLRPPHGLVQMLTLKDIHLLLSTDAGLVAASDYSVYRILPVPLSVQVVQLANSGNFEDALALCKMLPPEDSKLRAAKEDNIHIRFGHALFDQGEYAEAMDHFGESSLDLNTILSLFPFIKLPSLGRRQSKLSLEGHSHGTNADNSELPDGVGSSDQSELTDLKFEESERFQEPQQKRLALTALSSFLMSKRSAVTEKAESEETDAAVAAIVKSADTRQGSAKGSPAKGDTASRANGDFDSAEQYHARDLATVLDTAAVQTMLLTDQSQLALELLRGSNYCDVTACEEVMLTGGHFRELLQLYKSHKMHREALDLLNRLAESPNSFTAAPKEGEFGAKQVVDFLMTCGDQDPKLILDSSEWILKTSPEEALTMFASITPPLPVNLVLSHLKERAPELRVFYLENMLNKHPKGSARPADLQKELIQLYLSKVLTERADLEAEGKWDERTQSESREKLLNALQSSTPYSPEVMLRRLPKDGLYQERAFLLGKLGQHHLALTLYVHKLHEPDLALAYCDRLYLASKIIPKSGVQAILPGVALPADKAASNIYLTLLEVYLKPVASMKAYDRSLASVTTPLKTFASTKPSSGTKSKGQVGRKIAEIEGAEESKYSDSETVEERSRSDDEGATTEKNASRYGLMLDASLSLLKSRWDRLDGAQALRMLPSDILLQVVIYVEAQMRQLPQMRQGSRTLSKRSAPEPVQNLESFLEPLLRTSSEAYRNSAVIKSLHRSENLQVREELLRQRKRCVKINSERACSICQKRIGTSVFAVYPNGSLAHFVCHRDKGTSANQKTTTT